MINAKRLLALIPARGGSKRLENKNSRNLQGKPLIAWSIEAGLQSQYVDRVIVSTDSIDIARTANKYGADTPFMRPEILASDTANVTDVIKHAIKMLAKQKDFYEYIILLQPTSPLRGYKHIDEAIEILIEKSANGVIGVAEIEHPVEWTNTLPEDGSMKNFIKMGYRNIRSQDFQPRYRINGAIYVNKIENFLDEDTLFLKEKCFAYVMPKEVSIDIDTLLDFKIADYLMKNQ